MCKYHVGLPACVSDMLLVLLPETCMLAHACIGSACVSTIALLAHVSSQQEVVGMVEELSKAGAMRNTTVVSAAEGCGLGERYAALCSALSMGERVRDQGGHSFVVLDDISCMVRPFQERSSSKLCLCSVHVSN